MNHFCLQFEPTFGYILFHIGDATPTHARPPWTLVFEKCPKPTWAKGRHEKCWNSTPNLPNIGLVEIDVSSIFLVYGWLWVDFYSMDGNTLKALLSWECHCFRSNLVGAEPALYHLHSSAPPNFFWKQNTSCFPGRKVEKVGYVDVRWC